MNDELPQEQAEMKARQELKTAEESINFGIEQALERIEPSPVMSAAEVKRLSRNALHDVYMRIPDDDELTGVLAKYKKAGFTVFGLMHAVAAEYMLKGMNPPGVAYLNLITARLSGKVALPLMRTSDDREDEDESGLSRDEIRKLLED